jgi:3-keto-5-aminohexanoate cleavage enzyme
MALRLVRKGYIKPPLHFNFVLGVNGGAAGTPRDLLFMKESIPEGSTFTVSGIGRCQLEMNVMAMLIGGHVRLGLEDNLKYNRERIGVSNAEFVERIVRIAKEMNIEIATPAEARQILGLPERVK